MQTHNQTEKEKSEVCIFVNLILYISLSPSSPLSLSFPLSLSLPLSLVLQKAKEHLLLVTQKRSSYRAAVEESKRQARATFKASDGSFVPPNTNCTIDFAQQVHYSSNPLQPRSIYFLTPRKAALFGSAAKPFPDRWTLLSTRLLTLERVPMQLSACLTTFFNHHGLRETTVSLHADNCTAQKKSYTMMQYLMWRVLTGLHHISFMVISHTRFVPDGMLKRIFHKTEASGVTDIEQAVQSLSVVNDVNLLVAR